jgi:lipopolysaccharide transport system ATP-binding protein
LREEVEEKLDSIIEFSGLGDFIYAPLNTYSTGMGARLGFAVIAHIDADILLVDEVLAVGDAQFQTKCKRTMEGFRERGGTMFFVSHDVQSIERLCNRAIWIDGGELMAIGEPEEVIARYVESQTPGTE